MAKQNYRLNKGEKIVFKAESIRHGLWGAFTNVLVVTNQCVILEEYGLWRNYKSNIRYPLKEINQAILGYASGEEAQLELYFDDHTEVFTLQYDDDNDTTLRTLVMAINDQMSEDANLFDYNFYQGIADRSKRDIKLIEYGAKVGNANSEIDVQHGLSFVGDIAMSVLTSGDISMKGLQKGISKAAKKQKSKQLLGSIADEFLDEFGIHDIQDCFTEIENDFREEFGLKPKLTHAEIKEMRKLEKERHEEEIIRQQREAYTKQVSQAKQTVRESKGKSSSDSTNDSRTAAHISINEQLDMLKKLKELLDLGVLTQEEFDAKKNEIMNS